MKNDSDAIFEQTYHLNATNFEPLVACPHDVGNVRPVSEVGGIPINQALIGSCTGGKFEDLAVATEIIRGKKVHPKIRMIIISASMGVYKEALQTRAVATLIDAEAVVCGPLVVPTTEAIWVS